MKVLIVEDEPLAQNNIKNLILGEFPDAEIIGMLSSVRTATEWFSKPENQADIVFLDVELSDGMCFDIFDKVSVKSNIIITTAYDTYAIRAFKIKAIDYLLKPIDTNDLREAVARCRDNQESKPKFDFEALREALTTSQQPVWKQRFVIRLGDKIVVLHTNEIVGFLSEDKSTYAITQDSKRYIVDMTLDSVQECVDPSRFFRVSRSQIIALDDIKNISKHLNNRLKISLLHDPQAECFVSRFRTTDFMDWLEGKTSNN